MLKQLISFARTIKFL